ncbi:Prolyl 4-hydroxylase [Thalictrum thalictroides]|uniref:procollagen-proline 4-dioxygenase n=1 Tax=Thalictrum thalictroides TaxID=46969 RepID=A0A7J6X269_THATH|nr:Prolyl 4-hydroxylase [Thalictrum thalictroides]
MKSKRGWSVINTGSSSISGFRKRFSLPIVLLSCSVFFLAGFYGSILLSQNIAGTPTTSRILESEEHEEKKHEPIPYGKSGDSFIHSISSQVLSWKPRAVYYPRFASAEQCETIIKLAKETLKPSTLALRKGETDENTKGVRTSSGTFLSASEDNSGVLELIEQKIARATLIPQSHGEAFNILRYEIGQRYLSHYDAFNPSEYGPQKSQRVASFLLYLSDVEEGGETMFPYENGLNMDISYDYHKCIGLKVKPRQGDGLLFYSLLLNGTIDQLSLHGSCPVVKGEKWVATKWIRDQDQED